MLAALLGLSASLILATPAQASSADCYTSTVCLWEHSDFTGQLWRQYPAQITPCRSFVPDGFNDEATRIWNRSDKVINIYEHANCKGRGKAIFPGEGVNFDNTFFNDVATSINY
ncbi:hypothetical protein GCM10009539_03850 [Cryptosporangium japonicum]|uniref:Peptidase inhibitor family I36 n=1 Tax=Cryptosporangium japonicum TaxID=80872 RepID=A0ABN0THL9_9ACTN